MQRDTVGTCRIRREQPGGGAMPQRAPGGRDRLIHGCVDQRVHELEWPRRAEHTDLGECVRGASRRIRFKSGERCAMTEVAATAEHGNRLGQRPRLAANA